MATPRRRYQPHTTEQPVYRRPQRSPVSQAVVDSGLDPVDGYVFPPHPLPGGPTGQVVMVFTAPAPPLSVNATTGRHYGTTHTDKLLWQGAGRDVAEEYAAELAPYRGHRVELTFCLPLRNHTRADSANYTSGVSCKAFCDGLTRTGLLIPDDTAEWITTDAVFWPGGPTRDEVRVRIRVAEPPWDGRDPA